MDNIVFNAKLLSAMHFLQKYLAADDVKFIKDVPKVNVDGNLITELKDLAFEMNTDAKVAALYAIHSHQGNIALEQEALQALNTGIKKDIKSLINYAYRTAQASEYKAVHMVRTVYGVRRFGQPRGSIIVKNGSKPLDALTALVNDAPGYDKLADKHGRIFYVGDENGKWTIRNQFNQVLHQEASQEGSLRWLNQAVGGSQSKPAGSYKKNKDKDKPGTSRNSGHRTTGDHERDKLFTQLEDINSTYAITSSQKTNLNQLTTEQLTVYKNARDRGLNHAQAMATAEAVAKTNDKKAA